MEGGDRVDGTGLNWLLTDEMHRQTVNLVHEVMGQSTMGRQTKLT
jgi:hypothetical protein